MIVNYSNEAKHFGNVFDVSKLIVISFNSISKVLQTVYRYYFTENTKTDAYLAIHGSDCYSICVV